MLGIILLAGIVIGVGLYLYADNKADIMQGYEKSIETGGEIEARYLQHGEYETKNRNHL